MPIISGFTVNLADGAQETTSTTGTGTYSLNGEAPGFKTFVAAIGSGNRCAYAAALGSDREVGLGTVTSGAPATLSRDLILSSTNGGAAVNWGAGTKDIFVTAPAALLNQIFTLGASNWTVIWGGTSGGSANVQTLSVSPAITSATTAGMQFDFISGFTTTSATPTLNINGQGAVTLKTQDGANLPIGALQQNRMYRVTKGTTNFYVHGVREKNGTTQATTSGTTKDFTIPTDARQIIVSFESVSLDSTGSVIVQLGTGGSPETSGYTAASGAINDGTTSNVASATGGFIIRLGSASSGFSGHMILTAMGSNLWIASHAGRFGTGVTISGGGDKTLAGVLNLVRVTTTSANNFDNGSVNVQVWS